MEFSSKKFSTPEIRGGILEPDFPHFAGFNAPEGPETGPRIVENLVKPNVFLSFWHFGVRIRHPESRKTL